MLDALTNSTYTTTIYTWGFERNQPQNDCEYKKVVPTPLFCTKRPLAGNLYCSPSPPLYVAEIWRRMQMERGCRQVPGRLPRKNESATPPMQSDGGCRQVPRLPRKVPRRHGRLTAPSEPPEPKCPKCHACHAMWRPRLPCKWNVDVAKGHACHAVWRWMSPSATAATQSAAASRMTVTGPSAPPEPAKCHKYQPAKHTKLDVANCHTCHAMWRLMSPSATPPRLPRKAPRRHGRLTGPKRATRARQVP